ncbi:hypothetical protein TNCT_370281 [Trichonephila clavata]|uniref:Uncharacterized protein n=1 Tax=Trichonephila clavata TaxID=2740835 RepID=A0A8X6GUU1_TRICU|nr:hypothetical protein TNCT_370281 [Trichonephila clavata]
MILKILAAFYYSSVTQYEDSGSPGTSRGASLTKGQNMKKRCELQPTFITCSKSLCSGNDGTSMSAMTIKLCSDLVGVGSLGSFHEIPLFPMTFLIPPLLESYIFQLVPELIPWSL